MVNENKPIVVMALPTCRGRAIGDNAIRRAVAISDRFQPIIISDSFPDQIPDRVRVIKVSPPRFNYLHRLCHVPNELGFAWAVRKALKSLIPTGHHVIFVLCHGYTLAWFTGRWIHKRTGIPFGMFMHGHIFGRPKGMYDPRVTAFYRAVAPTCYREADLLFALSPAQAELAVQAGATARRVIITPNGLDLMDIGIAPTSVDKKIANFMLHKPLRFLYVGRLSIEKGVNILIRSCALLKKKDIKFRLNIIGTGPEKDKLHSLASALELNNWIEFVGPIPRNQLGDYYLESDMLFVPSISEALGNVVLEGMASGCVVVASNTGGIPSMIDDGVNGVLFVPGDADALADSIIALTSNPEKLTGILRAGVKKIREVFSWDVIGRTIVHALNQNK